MNGLSYYLFIYFLHYHIHQIESNLISVRITSTSLPFKLFNKEPVIFILKIKLRF